MSSIRVIDSHTGGEPTRLVIEGGPDLGAGPLSDRVVRFREQFDAYRSAIVNEPRGSDTVVGALLCSPHEPGCQLGVIFFNNVGYLSMCGHGTIGLVASLAHTDQLKPGAVRIDTPAGAIDAMLHENGEVTISNVPSYRKVKQAAVQVPGIGEVRGDVAWGGNWFFLIDQHNQRIDLDNIDALTDFTWRVRQAVNAQGYPEVDHVELFVPSGNTNTGSSLDQGREPARRDEADSRPRRSTGETHQLIPNSRNFVLCPGKAYDRSPCGTGTSAKVACLAADGKLAEDEPWIQESVIGSTFVARYRWLDRSTGRIAPSITGTAHVTAEATLRLDPADPFCWGIRSPAAPGR